MGQEYFINDQNLETKIRELLPSQGGAGAGFDLSASTQIIPIVDLTESAEGSNVRQDLQTAFGYNNTNAVNLTNVTDATIIDSTGYFKFKGLLTVQSAGSTRLSTMSLFDGTTAKIFIEFRSNPTTDTLNLTFPFDYTLFLSAGKSVIATVNGSANLVGSFRQIADIEGRLTPLT